MQLPDVGVSCVLSQSVHTITIESDEVDSVTILPNMCHLSSGSLRTRQTLCVKRQISTQAQDAAAGTVYVTLSSTL